MNTKTAFYSLVLLTVGAALLAKSPKVASHPSPLPPKLRSSTPAPGIYAAVPYTAIVVIPTPMDRKFVASAGRDLDHGATVETPAIKLLPLHR
jgi:hypothetical protein